MIMHIVMWKFKEENKKENMNLLKQMLTALPSQIEEINHLEVGKEVNLDGGNFDMVLVSEFKTMEDLAKYKVHPEHVKVSKFCTTICEERVCVDYKV